MAWLIGVDEAGRGPVLGSMFVAGIGVRNRKALPSGLRDSKVLAPSERAEFADRLENTRGIEVAIAEITASEIDAAPGRLNDLTRRGHHAVIQTLYHPQDTHRCIVDACDVDADRWQRSLQANLHPDISIEARHGADESEPIVSAASILAKQSRETHVDMLRSRYGEIGSGYPSDRRTRAFLKQYLGEHSNFPSCTRTTWSTCADVRASVEQTSLG